MKRPHPGRIGGLNPASLATQSVLASRQDEAIAMAEHGLADEFLVFGNRSWSRATNLTLAYRLAGRTSEAVTFGRQSVSYGESTMGPSHHVTLGARVQLAVALEFSGDRDGRSPQPSRSWPIPTRLMKTQPAALQRHGGFWPATTCSIAAAPTATLRISRTPSTPRRPQ